MKRLLKVTSFSNLIVCHQTTGNGSIVTYLGNKAGYFKVGGEQERLYILNV